MTVRNGSFGPFLVNLCLCPSRIYSGLIVARERYFKRGSTLYLAYFFRSCSWQLPRPEADIPRMGSDVGATRIWNRLLDAAFDNSDRRKHGMGYLGRLMTRRRRAKRRAPESTRKRKLGGNSGDHRPFFTYWMTTVQIFIMLISIAVYGIGPIGIDLYKKSGMVSRILKMD